MKTWPVGTSVLAALLMLTNIAHANSFVGNGGSAGDVELAVTLMQIKEIFKTIESKSDQKVDLCTCSPLYANRPQCEPLKSLDEKQVKFCTSALYQQAPEMLRLVSSRDNVRVRWTDGPIEVLENGRTRSVDAVANRETGEITVNQSRFRGMRQADRVFLLTHELMHLTKFEGKPLTDNGAIGPYSGEEGSRNFINAMASAASVLQGAYPKEIKSYRAKLRRSQAWKPFWVGVDVGGAGLTEEPEGAFAFKSYSRLGFLTRYQWTHFGVLAGFRTQYNDKSIHDSIKAEEQVSIFSLGASYRFFFSSDPLTFWGQTHLLTQVALEYVSADYKTHEDIAGAGVTIGENDHAKTFGASLGVNYYIPLFFGLWTYVGASYDVHPYKYKTLAINYNKNTLSGFVGLSYAF